MTNFPLAPGTDNSVPAAMPPDNAAAFQYFSAAVASLAQPSAPQVAPAPSPAPAPAPTPSTGAFLTRGPWVAGGLYLVVPSGPLLAVPEEELDDYEEPPIWYAITRGRYVGVTMNNGLAVNATTGISAGLQRKYKTQALALAAFNEMLRFGLVSVVA
ncbi:hypothetical protein C8F04DRAFT_1271652 [Mycena alexandri]|uniref:Uncharacterized protein n=1 Tax=Mycena alexandri TaxID=1745969 RepID=A0AAD6WS34_9AGAR|nr:hypothetical protein C8F04DRAFT_1271652 [Mycena alexandri]